MRPPRPVWAIEHNEQGMQWWKEVGQNRGNGWLLARWRAGSLKLWASESGVNGPMSWAYESGVNGPNHET